MPFPWSRSSNFSSPLAGEHVLITGGSSGIGLALAAALVERNANVTLVARDASRLASAASVLRELDCRKRGVDPWVCTRVADVTDAEQLSAAVADVEAEVGPVDVLIANAGSSEPGRFVEQPPDVAERAMRLNYFGALNAVRSVLPEMLSRGSGKIVLVASAAGVCGFAGFTSYSPSKWALRGFADCLRNELLGTGVAVHVAYPPDTDTPGYERESATKPPECHAASRAAGDSLYSPERVAERAVRDLEKGRYHLSSPDLGQNMLVAAMAGLSPHPLPLPVELFLAPLIAVALRVFGWIVDRAARKAVEERKGRESSGGGGGGGGARSAAATSATTPPSTTAAARERPHGE